MTARRPVSRDERTWMAAIAAGLFLVTLALFSRAFSEGFGFLLYDDHEYVTRNAHVQQGMTGENLKWAFDPSTIVAANWHPVTLVSHMLDCEIFHVQPGDGFLGLGPRGHHLTNVLFHALNTALLFVVLRLMTGALWPSALVAALFGWHPVHVESVAWVAERKDVLSTLFWLLTMLAYWGYVRERSIKYYVLALVSLGIGLLAKPMLVTLPCVLLLMDAWPLERFHDVLPISKATWRRAGWLVLEKVPMFALAAMASVWTLRAQSLVGALPTVREFTLSERFGNAMISYCLYLWTMIMPRNLAAYYPMQQQYDLTAAGLLALAVLAVITVLVVAAVRRAPYLAVGWFWYLGTLVPVIGLVQVGEQGMADRYTYVPSIGALIMLAWALQALVRRDSGLVIPIAAGVILWLASLAYLTYEQIGYWKNTETLFTHALAVTENNYVAHNALGTYYKYEDPSPEKALEQFDAALSIAPNSARAHYHRGTVLAQLRRPHEAIVAFQHAIQDDYPQVWMPHTALGSVLSQMKRYDEAEQHFREALALRPSSLEATFGLASVLVKQGKTEAAVEMLQNIVKNVPGHVPAATILARIYATCPDRRLRNGTEAVRLATNAKRLTRNPHAKILDTLAAAYAETGQFDLAVQTANAALQLANRHSAVAGRANRPDLRVGWREFAQDVEARIRLYEKGSPYREDPATFTF